jgi:hypothetical protein
LEVDTWRKKARDRRLWSEVIREAAAHGGCGAKEGDDDEEEEEEEAEEKKKLK